MVWIRIQQNTWIRIPKHWYANPLNPIANTERSPQSLPNSCPYNLKTNLSLKYSLGLISSSAGALPALAPAPAAGSGLLFSFSAWLKLVRLDSYKSRIKKFGHKLLTENQWAKIGTVGMGSQTGENTRSAVLNICDRQPTRRLDGLQQYKFVHFTRPGFKVRNRNYLVPYMSSGSGITWKRGCWNK